MSFSTVLAIKIHFVSLIITQIEMHFTEIYTCNVLHYVLIFDNNMFLLGTLERFCFKGGTY